MKDFSSTDFKILKLIWDEKELSSREIHDRISENTNWAYSTTRTVLERMVKKGYLRKGRFHGIYLYTTNISKVKAFAIQISAFAEKILENDYFSILPLFTKKEILTEKELEELKQLLNSKDFKK